LTSIHGVDPIIVNNIKVQTQKSVVIETQKPKVSDNHKEKKEQDQDQRHPQPHLQDLMAIVEKLNKLLEQNKIKLSFQVVNELGVIKVQLTEIIAGTLFRNITRKSI
jgi:uncharacterized FlaG/YvyC family protein